MKPTDHLPRTRWIAALALGLLAACARPPEPEGAAAGATTSITVKGSDTLVQLGQRWAELYMAAHPEATVQVTGGGSGTGISALINGTTDICQASRAMKESERVAVKEKRGVDPVEIPVALDGLAVYVHESNPVPSLSVEDLRALYLGQVKSWKEVGGPDAKVVLYGRENSSGTYGYFKEHVLEEGDFAPEVQTLPGTAAVADAVAKDPNGIGYGGVAYARGIRLVPISKEKGGEAVAARLEEVESGRYPLSRSLYWYTAGAPSGLAAAFRDYALSPEGQKVVSEVGYYPLRVGAAAPPEAPAQGGAASPGTDASP
ncbi:phosphate ABC transporter substrate-binding protein [Myxococcota bacterium]|nr:phosphate ABC transporter substrate-binding protein [Myxococcota bacterium]